MMSSHNASPQDPREFLAEMQRNSMRENQQESLAPLDQPQLTTSPQEPQSPQDPNAAMVALFLFTSQAQGEMIMLLSEMHEVQLNSNNLSKENKQMRLTIEGLKEAIAERDASIEELTARIETLTKEKR